MAVGRIISNKTKIAVIKRDGPNCQICGREGFVSEIYGDYTVLEKEPYKKWINSYDGTYLFEHRSMEFDHKIPISKGGKNNLENIQILCRKCNRRKGNKCLEDEC